MNNLLTKVFFLIMITALTTACNDQQNTPKTVVENRPTSTNNKTKDAKTSKKKILFFGDSLTAGYGLSEEQAFPNQIQRKLDSLKMPYQAINAGLSGETTAGGKARIDWVLSQGSIDVFVLELGANDMLRGLPLEETKKNLDEILSKVTTKNPSAKIIIAGMQAAPNLGKKYGDQFATIFSSLAKKYTADLIPFFLDGVAGIPELNQQDGIHPNANGVKIVTKNVWSTLRKSLGK